ncbi:MAG: Colicin receptor precursor [Pseudomonadota bacterium]|jgi:iron complex outermembrane receptor protein
MKYSQRILVLSIAAAVSQLAVAQDARQVEEMIVTGVRMDAPLNITTDPKTPRQPLPAHDGADYLKTIPGFSVIRKGGTDGDPVLRGMAGSRLSMVLDGEMILGGCNNRMDPPTAYIFPETFDSIQVIKGPQSVQHGPGNSAGVVLFERDNKRPEDSGWKVHSSALAASFGRHDEVLDASYSSPKFALRGAATNASADNYEDGDGTEIHSLYQRWSTQLSLTWTPDDDTRVELGAARSDGEAAYSDRGVDGSKFARENYSIKLVKSNLTPWLKNVEANAYYNYVDHVMDNYTLRTPSGMMPNPSAMNPDRETTGARLALTLQPSVSTDLVIGLDTQANEHSNRFTMNQTMRPYEGLVRSPDAEFRQIGVFAELGWNFGAASRIVGGVRADDWNVEDLRMTFSPTMMVTLPNPTYGQERSETLHSAFLRYETDLGRSGATFFAGVGHNERFPDYWEMIAKETATSVSALNIESEKLTQLDVGMMYRKGNFDGSISTFVSDIEDYLMIQSGYMKPAMAMGGMMPMPGMTTMRSASIVRNIDARTWGVEVDGQYRINDDWRTEVTLASVRGANDTDGRTLPQLSPLEGRIGLYYDNTVWTGGILWRSIAEQSRFDIGRGNIVGQDIGPTDGADIVSLNGGWRFSDRLMFTAGIDNMLDTTYAEHISRAGASIPGFDQISRVNEPGRTLWLRAQYSF